MVLYIRVSVPSEETTDDMQVWEENMAVRSEVLAVSRNSLQA